jgi:2Fe-2S ferredoxin
LKNRLDGRTLVASQESERLAMSLSVRVEPLGLEFTADEGETVMAAAQRQGYLWPTICQGNALCTACWVEVIDGVNALGPIGEAEAQALKRVADRARLGDAARLACQATVHGAVLVRKDGVELDAS